MCFPFSLGITVFHDAAIPPDDFVANCTIPFEDLMHRDKEATDFWVSLYNVFSCTKQKYFKVIIYNFFVRH